MYFLLYTYTCTLYNIYNTLVYYTLIYNIYYILNIYYLLDTTISRRLYTVLYYTQYTTQYLERQAFQQKRIPFKHFLKCDINFL